MNSRLLVNVALAVSVLGLATAAAGAGYLLWRMASAPGADGAGTAIADAGLGADFELSNQHGGTTRLGDLRGKAVLLFFGYTHCPDVCPSTLFAMAQARKLLGADAARLQGVFVTVDPARDTPQRLREYVGHFDDSFLALTGSEAQLLAVARSFGAAFERGEMAADGGYLMAHTTFGYLVDPQGRVVRLFQASTAAEDMAAAVRKSLQHSS